MMKKQVFFLYLILLLMVQCSAPGVREEKVKASGPALPRVLIITTGLGQENATLAQGIVLAIQTFNKLGATVRLEPRDVLFDYSELSKYNILVLSTFPGYHDADRKYSLSYMSDEELHNLTMFVGNGGVMISADNVGRNYTDGTDRITVFQHLRPENWELSKCYGVMLTEKNMTGYGLAGNIPGYLQWDISRNSLSDEGHELWTLVPEQYDPGKVKIHGYWKRGQDSTAAMIENSFGKGKSYLLALSGMLHPRNDGGFWSEEQISEFYSYVIDSYNKDNDIGARLNPWPAGHDYAFCVSLNAEGKKEHFERVFKMLETKEVIPTVFVNGSVGEDIKSVVESSGYSLASSGYAYINHTELQYPQAVEDILLNENFWNTDFKGFRFPFTQPAGWSILALGEHGYTYESSIGADNLDFFHGSIIPYNLVVTNDGFFRSTDILEIAPSYHDDYYFLEALKVSPEPDSNMLEKDIRVYRKYLGNFWKYAVKPYDGLMVYLGHPGYVGYNDSTLTALSGLIDQVKTDNTWVTTLAEVAEFRSGLGELRIYIEHDGKRSKIMIDAPGNIYLKEVCLSFKDEIVNAAAKEGKTRIDKQDKGSRLIFDAFDGQSVSIEFK
jgi:hypothetical protein